MTHTSLAPQLAPHSPQLALSLERSTQELLQSASPSLHPPEQLPRLHTCPDAHALPHEPQFRALACRSTHAGLPRSPPGHTVCPTGQLHIPAVHVAPVAHALPHEPQLKKLLWRSTQVEPPPNAPGHAVCPVGQPGIHWPFTH